MMAANSKTAGRTPRTAALALLAACAMTGLAAPPEKSGPPTPLPDRVVEAWKKAPAKVGWLRADTFGSLMFFPETSIPYREGKAGDVPGFDFYPWKESLLAGLPDPGAAFGLE